MIRTLVASVIGLGLMIVAKTALADDTAAQADPAKEAEIRQELLSKFDKNGDGKLDASEKAAAKAGLAKAKKKGAKAGNGQLAADAILKKYDTNGDGKLDETELAAMLKDLQAKREAHKKKTAT